MKSQIDPHILSSLRADYLACDRASERRALVEGTAAGLGVSVQTLYRKLQLGAIKPRKKRMVSAAVDMKRETLNAYGKLVFEFALENSRDMADCTYRIAFEHLQASERIPAWVTEQQIYKAIARQELENEWSPVAKRFERKNPMTMYQCDFSVSRHIKHLGLGRLCVWNAHATKMPGAKNDRRRLWFGAAVDDASRVLYMEYFLSEGEKAITAQQFLLRVFARKPALAHLPQDFLLQGIPQQIYVDRGSGWVDGSTQIGLARMGIQCIIGANERDAFGRALQKSNKKARGKIEKAIQTMKRRFEMAYSLNNPHGTETSLAELNHALWDWLEEWNQMAHPTRKAQDGSAIGKWNVFSPALASAMYPSEDALGLFGRTFTKKVRSRLVNVAPNTYCVAPLWASDGEEIEIFSVHGFYYTMHVAGDGTRTRVGLDFQQDGEHRTAPGETLRMKIESDNDLLTGSDVNSRFNDELQKISGGAIAIASIPDELWMQIEHFFDESHTVGEIKAKAQDVHDLMLAPISNVSVDEFGRMTGGSL